MFENVGFQPPKHVWSQHVVELLDLVLLGNVCKLFQKPLQVAAQINAPAWRSWWWWWWGHCKEAVTSYGGYSLESLRGQEVQQVEELLQVVLKRSAGQQQLVLQRVVVQHAKELTTGRQRQSRKDNLWQANIALLK